MSMVSECWQLVKKNLIFLIPVNLVLFGLAIGYQLFVRFGFGSYELSISGRLVFSLLYGLAVLVVNLGLKRIYLKVLDGGSLSLNDMLVEPGVLVNGFFAFMLSALVAVMLMGVNLVMLVIAIFASVGMGTDFKQLLPVAFVIGFVVLVLEAIFLGAKLWMMVYFVVDKRFEASRAFRASWRASSGHVFEIVKVGAMVMLVNVVGLFALGLGLLVTVPLTNTVWARLYRKLGGSFLEADSGGV